MRGEGMNARAAMANRILVAGFVGLILGAFCCSLPFVWLSNIRAESIASSIVFKGPPSMVEQCTLDPSSSSKEMFDDALCRPVNLNHSFCWAREGLCGSAGGGGNVTVSSMLPQHGFSCYCRYGHESQAGIIMLQSDKTHVGTAWWNTMWGKSLSLGLASIGVGTALLSILWEGCGALRQVYSMAVSGRISCRVRARMIRLKAPLERRVGPHSDRVREVAMKTRVRRAERLLQGVRLVVSVLILFETLTFVWNIDWHSSDYRIGAWYAYDSAVIPCICVTVLTLFQHLKFHEVSPTLLDGLNVSLSGTWVWRYFVMGHFTGRSNSLGTEYIFVDKGYLFHGPWLLCSRMVQGLVCGNATLSIVLNLIVTAVDVHAFGIAGPEHAGPYLFQQLVVCMAVSIIFWVFEQQMFAEAIALVDAETSSSNYTLAHRVLEATCDVVVCLDSDLNLAGSCPKLAHMLLKHPSSSSDGCSFVNVLSPDDASRVQSHMQEEEELTRSMPTRLDPAMVLHVHLVDAYNQTVPVQLHWCCGAKHDGEVKHLVGITERASDSVQSSGTPLVRAQGDLRLSPLTEDSAMNFPCDIDMDRALIGVGSVSSQASASSFESLDEEVSAGLELSVCIDAASADLTFLRCSSAFANLSWARGVGSGLRDWLRDKSAGPFLSWLSSSVPDPFAIRLRPPGMRKGYYFAQCRRGDAQPESHAPCAGAMAGTGAANAVDLIFDTVQLRFRDKDKYPRRDLQSSHSIAIVLRVRCDDLVICGAEVGELADSLPASLKPGGSLQTCMTHYSSFAHVVMGLAQEVVCGRRRAAVSLDLGRWKICADDFEERLVQFRIVGFVASSPQPESGSLICQLKMDIPRVAEAPARGSDRGRDNAKKDIRIVLASDSTESDLMILGCSSEQMGSLLGFSPQGCSFVQLLRRPVPFMKWVSSLVEFEDDETVPETALEFGEISFSSSSLIQQGWEIRATCRCDTLPRDMGFGDALCAIKLSDAQKVNVRLSL